MFYMLFLKPRFRVKSLRTTLQGLRIRVLLLLVLGGRGGGIVNLLQGFPTLFGGFYSVSIGLSRYWADRKENPVATCVRKAQRLRTACASNVALREKYIYTSYIYILVYMLISVSFKVGLRVMASLWSKQAATNESFQRDRRSNKKKATTSSIHTNGMNTASVMTWN